MALPTIRRRLEQIKELGLPHIILGGNILEDHETDDDKEVIGCLNGNIPEVIKLNDATNHLTMTPGPSEDYAERFSKATGSIVPKKIFEGSRAKVADKLETHVFYDPKARVTHYFLMPSRELIKEYSSQ